MRGLEAADRAELHREIARNNGERIIADPSIALDAITYQQSTFMRRYMAMFAHRHSDGIDQFNEVMGAMRGSPDVVELGQDGRGQDREVAMRRARRQALIRHARASDAILEAKHRGLAPSDEQRRQLGAARRTFDEVWSRGWQDAEPPITRTTASLVKQIPAGSTVLSALCDAKPNCALIRSAGRIASSNAGRNSSIAASASMSRATVMGDMAKSLQRDPQLESLLANRKLGINFELGRRLGQELAFTHGIDIGRGRGVGL